MSHHNFYSLPDLPYGYGDLAPHMSEEVLKLHHDKHHQGYVNSANAILEKLDKAREEGQDLDMKATLKQLSFHVGGHVLHSLFWKNLAPAGQGGDGPTGALAEAIDQEFGGLERFKQEFSAAAKGVEGSGWAALTKCEQTGRLMIMQIEKHNLNIYPAFRILMVIDVWEHAYYLDYKNSRGDFLDNFWKIVNWEEVGARL